MKKIIIISSMSLVLIGLGAYIFLSAKGDTKQINSNQPLGTMTEAVPLQEEKSVTILDEEGFFEGSLLSLAKIGVDYECTVDQTIEGMVSKGRVYISGQNIRTDFTTTVPSFGEMKSSMIGDAEYIYSWSSAMPTGFKMARTQEAPQTSASATENADTMNQVMKYKCAPWTKDASVFKLPNITFKEIPTTN